MSLSKELFGIYKKANIYMEALDCKQSEVTHAYRWPEEMIDGYNQALDEIDQHELSEEETERQIKIARCNWRYYMKDEKFSDDFMDEDTFIAKHLIQNKSKIFVRKS